MHATVKPLGPLTGSSCLLTWHSRKSRVRMAIIGTQHRAAAAVAATARTQSERLRTNTLRSHRAAESTSPNSSKTAPPLDKTSHHSNSSFFSAKDTATRKKSIQFSLCFAMCSIWFYVTATYNLKNTLNTASKSIKNETKSATVDDRCLCVVIMYVMAAAMINYLYHDCPSHNWHVSWKIWVKLIINILTWMRLFVKVLGSPIWQAVRRGCLSRRRPPPPPRAQKAQNLWTCFCSATTYKFIYGQLTFTNYS